MNFVQYLILKEALTDYLGFPQVAFSFISRRLVSQEVVLRVECGETGERADGYREVELMDCRRQS
jgi:hypothetical protein